MGFRISLLMVFRESSNLKGVFLRNFTIRGDWYDRNMHTHKNYFVQYFALVKNEWIKLKLCDIVDST